MSVKDMKKDLTVLLHLRMNSLSMPILSRRATGMMLHKVNGEAQVGTRIVSTAVSNATNGHQKIS